MPTEALPANDSMEVDEAKDTDSAFDSSNDQSSTTSVNSATYRGYIKNGRRYQSHGDYAMQPSDEKQWVSLSAGHVLFLILDCHRENPLFCSPLGEIAQNVLDLGTGGAEWAIGVGETFPSLTVHGVDLYPQPQQWVPPNVVLSVDDISKPWSWNKHFDLVHMRILMGSFDEAVWASLYQQAYENLEPGGWIEYLEYDISIFCDDDSMPADSLFFGENCRSFFLRCASRAGRPLDTIDHLQPRITSGGFTNVQVQDYKMPIGTWPKHSIYKDAARFHMIQMRTGLEGWLMYLMTAHGEPKPWSREEVREYADKLREELKRGYLIYNKAKRVWAQKPY